MCLQGNPTVGKTASFSINLVISSHQARLQSGYVRAEVSKSVVMLRHWYARSVLPRWGLKFAVPVCGQDPFTPSVQYPADAETRLG
jgi:hypothetical protein